jgi:diguanylate cyclase (GGDEF)-like protein
MLHTLASDKRALPSTAVDDDPATGYILQLLESGFPLMRFPHALELQFLQDAAEGRRQHFLLSGLISLLIYNGFLIVDFLMARDVFWMAVQLRVLLFTPISLALLYVAWRHAHRFMHLVPPIIYEVVVVGTGLAAAVSLAFILSETKSPFAHFYHVGFLVVIMYGNLVQRVRFWYAVVFSLALLGIHVAGVVLLDNFPPRLLWPIVMLVTSTAIFSLIANYAMERDERRRYLLTLRERGVVRALTRAHERLQELSRVDGLTGLYNRRHFQEYLQQVWERAQYDHSPLCVLMVDIDHFKKYNDRYGHPAGDECLRQVAKVLQSCLNRPEDLVARYGGEEFIAVLPQTEMPYAQMVAERVREAIDAMQMRHESSTTALYVTASIGVSSCHADFLLADSVVVSAADQALYQAKHEGRNRVCVRAVPDVQALSGASTVESVR